MSHPPNYWEQPSTPSVFPLGTNSLETRVRSLEIHLTYAASDRAELRHRIEEAEHQGDERQKEMERRLWRASWQIIGALATAVVGLLWALARPLLHL